MSDALGRRFEAACELASEAGALARRLQSEPGRPAATLKGAQDWVTAADGAVERFLAGRLQQFFPDDAFFGEEEGERPAQGGVPRHSTLRWVVDPIDGTSNYARLRPRWCVSIGLFEGDTPVIGVLEAPALGEQFRAMRGAGATLNGTRMAPSGCVLLSEAMVEFGWSPRADKDAHASMSRRLLAAGAMPRAGGSGALGLADVACGRADGFIELHIQLWDVAASLVLLAETGCAVEHRGFPGPIVAASPTLGPALARLAGQGDHREEVDA